MKLNFIEKPSFKTLDQYDDQIKRMLDRLSSQVGVISVYQIGGISTPGISDIDFVVVFEDKYRCFKNFWKEQSTEERYFFVHTLYGVNESGFLETRKFTFFHHYKLLYGKETYFENCLSEKDVAQLKTQTALEFLVKNVSNDNHGKNISYNQNS